MGGNVRRSLNTQLLLGLNGIVRVLPEVPKVLNCVLGVEYPAIGSFINVLEWSALALSDQVSKIKTGV